jgi:hypothetical protein
MKVRRLALIVKSPVTLLDASKPTKEDERITYPYMHLLKVTLGCVGLSEHWPPTRFAFA